MKQKSHLLWFCLLLLVSSCGYHSGHGGILGKYQTISIPYIAGDWDGSLTSALIQRMTQSGNLTYRTHGGALTLLVAVIDFDDEHIGYRYDLSKTGKIKSRVIPDETRLDVLVEVSVVEACSGTVLMGPVRIAACVDFDHDYYSSRNGINVFSLGQLTDYDEASDAALQPLSRQLAKKVVDYVNDNW